MSPKEKIDKFSLAMMWPLISLLVIAIIGFLVLWGLHMEKCGSL